LGLTIVSAIVATITAISTAGQHSPGTVIIIELPGRERRIEWNPYATGFSWLDDEVSILHSLSGALRDEGYQVSVAHSGEEALEEAHHDMPDIVLLDIWMRG